MDKKESPDVADALAARRFFQRHAADAGRVDALAREVERRMAERLELVRLQPERLLDAGAGLAQGLELLVRRYPQALPVALDAAHAMLSQARAARSVGGRMRSLFNGRAPQYVCGDFERLPFRARSFQLVWSNLALAWSDPLQAFKEFLRILDVGGLLMFSTYGPDTLRELRQAFAAVDRLPHTLRFIDMHDLGDMLGAAGFSEPVMDMEVFTLTYSDFDALAADLRLSGQSNAARQRRRGLTGRALYQGMIKAYEGMRQAGKLPATVEIVYGHAWRGEPRRTAEGHSVVKLDLKRR